MTGVFSLPMGIYEVVRWYGGFFFDMEGHLARLKRSLKEVCIEWNDADTLPHIASELIHKNGLGDCCATVYIEITRGAAKRKHNFPDPPVRPTVYAFASRLSTDTLKWERGIRYITCSRYKMEQMRYKVYRSSSKCTLLPESP